MFLSHIFKFFMLFSTNEFLWRFTSSLTNDIIIIIIIIIIIHKNLIKMARYYPEASLQSSPDLNRMLIM